MSEIYDAFHPLFLGTEETEHAESLQTALKRLGFYHGRIDGDFGRGTRRSLQAAQHELDIPASGEVDDGTASAIKELLRQAESGERWKLPRKSDPEVEVEEDQMALYREIMEENGIPPYFAIRRFVVGELRGVGRARGWLRPLRWGRIRKDVRKAHRRLALRWAYGAASSGISISIQKNTPTTKSATEASASCRFWTWDIPKTVTPEEKRSETSLTVSLDAS